MIYSLGSKSLAALAGVHPDLVKVVREAIGLTTQDFGVHEGLRTLARQREYVAAGVSTTLNSAHLTQPDGFGHAVDVVPFVLGSLRWEWPPTYKVAAAMRAAAEKHSVPLRWGGAWDRKLAELPADADGLEDAVQAYVARRKKAGQKRVFIDGPHFELI